VEDYNYLPRWPVSQLALEHVFNISDSRNNRFREKPDIQLCFVDANHVTVNKAYACINIAETFQGQSPIRMR
jgi:hypothetical protein